MPNKCPHCGKLPEAMTDYDYRTGDRRLIYYFMCPNGGYIGNWGYTVGDAEKEWNDRVAKAIAKGSEISNGESHN